MNKWMGDLLITSGMMAVLIGILLMSTRFFRKHYAAKCRYIIWLFIAVRLMIPVNLQISNSPVVVQKAYVSEEQQKNKALVNNKGNKGENKQKLADQKKSDNQSISDKPTGIRKERSQGISEEGRLLVNNLSFYDALLFLYVLWLLGALLFLLYHLIGYIDMKHRLFRESWQAREMDYTQQMEKIQIELGIRTPCQIRITQTIKSPMIAGFFHQILWLPHENFTKKEFEFICRHEMIHRKRHDIIYKWILLLANALHWFNPMIYFMLRAADTDIEMSCDSEATAAMGVEEKSEYSRLLLSLAASSMERRNYVFTTNFNGGVDLLKERISNIMEQKPRRGIVIIILTLALIGITGFSAIRGIEQIDVQYFGPDQTKTPYAQLTYQHSGGRIEKVRYDQNARPVVLNGKLCGRNKEQIIVILKNVYSETGACEIHMLEQSRSSIKEVYVVKSTKKRKLTGAKIVKVDGEERLRIRMDSIGTKAYADVLWKNGRWVLQKKVEETPKTSEQKLWSNESPSGRWQIYQSPVVNGTQDRWIWAEDTKTKKSYRYESTYTADIFLWNEKETRLYIGSGNDLNSGIATIIDLEDQQAYPTDYSIMEDEKEAGFLTGNVDQEKGQAYVPSKWISDDRIEFDFYYTDIQGTVKKGIYDYNYITQMLEACWIDGKEMSLGNEIDLNWIDPRQLDGSGKMADEVLTDGSADSKMPLLLAKMPKENIYLYTVNDGQIGIVKYGNQVQYFNWCTLTPRLILPKMSTQDIDQDNEKEIIISLYCDSGTGRSISDIHVLDLQKNGTYKDYTIAPEQYQETIKERISVHFDSSKNALICRMDGIKKNYPVSERGLPYRNYGYGAYVSYDIEEGIVLHCDLSVYYEGESTGDPVGEITAKVIFNGKELVIDKDSMRFES